MKRQRTSHARKAPRPFIADEALKAMRHALHGDATDGQEADLAFQDSESVDDSLQDWSDVDEDANQWMQEHCGRMDD